MSRDGLQVWPGTGPPAAARYRPRFGAGTLRERAQALSLDVVLGVLSATAFAASWTEAVLPLGWWLSLPLATWVVYAVDHRLDARRAGSAACDFKHRYFQRHAAPLGSAILVAALGLCVLVWTLPVRMIVVGGLLAVASGLHLGNAQAHPRERATTRPRAGDAGPPKELTAAVTYTAGIWVVPVLVGDAPPWTALLVALHFLAALANLLSFSLLELDVDVREDQRSLVRARGVPSVVRLLAGTTAVGVLGGACGAMLGPARLVPYLLVLLLVLMTPLGLWVCRSSLLRHCRYRTIGDLAFLLLALPAWLT